MVDRFKKKGGGWSNEALCPWIWSHPTVFDHLLINVLKEWFYIPSNRHHLDIRLSNCKTVWYLYIQQLQCTDWKGKIKRIIITIGELIWYFHRGF